MWRQRLASAAGWPVRVEFLPRDGTLYGFKLVDRGARPRHFTVPGFGFVTTEAAS